MKSLLIVVVLSVLPSIASAQGLGSGMHPDGVHPCEVGPCDNGGMGGALLLLFLIGLAIWAALTWTHRYVEDTPNRLRKRIPQETPKQRRRRLENEKHVKEMQEREEARKELERRRAETQARDVIRISTPNEHYWLEAQERKRLSR